MNKPDPFLEISLPRRLALAAAPDLAARMPRFLGGPENPGARFASLRVLFVGCGSIGLEFAQHIARWQVCEIAIVDPKRFKLKSVITHSIPREAVGQSKASYAAKLCKGLSPRTRVFALLGEFAAVPLSRLAGFDVVFLATDNLVVELQVGQVCLALRIPVIQGSVHGATLCGHVRFFGHGGADEPCAACGYTRDEWAHLNRSTAFSCEGWTRPAAVADAQPTLSLGTLCSLCAQLALLQFTKDRLALGAPVRNTILEYCAYTHRAVLTNLARNPACPCEHVVLRRAAPPRPLPDCTFDDLAAIANANNPRVSFEVDSTLWVEQARCKCGEWRSVRKFVDQTGLRLGRCGKCRQPLTAHPFHSHHRVPASALEAARSQSLRDLGAHTVRWVIVRSDDAAVLFLNPNEPSQLNEL